MLNGLFRRPVLSVSILVYLVLVVFLGLGIWRTLDNVGAQLRADFFSLSVQVERLQPQHKAFQQAVSAYLEAPAPTTRATIERTAQAILNRIDVISFHFDTVPFESPLKTSIVEELVVLTQSMTTVRDLAAGEATIDAPALEDMALQIDDSNLYIFTENQTFTQEKSVEQKRNLELFARLIMILLALTLAALAALLFAFFKIQAQRSAMEKVAITDDLTALFNRRHFNTVYPIMFAHAKRQGAVLSLLMIDIDEFKAYNDAFGHAEGDIILQLTAAVIRNVASRTNDLTFRLGGEEFGCLIETKDKNDARAIAEEIRRSIAARNLDHAPNTSHGVITASIGLAGLPDDDIATPDDLFKRADDALYRAKDQGRNCVVAD